MRFLRRQKKVPAPAPTRIPVEDSPPVDLWRDEQVGMLWAREQGPWLSNRERAVCLSHAQSIQIEFESGGTGFVTSGYAPHYTITVTLAEKGGHFPPVIWAGSSEGAHIEFERIQRAQRGVL